MKTVIRRHLLLAGTLAALALTTLTSSPRPALAHEAKCPVCKLDVVQDTDQLDHEVALKFGRKRIEYRCVLCALQDAKTYNGDLTILAPSEIKGKPVLLARKAGKWSVAPETAVFVAQKVEHPQCQVGYRALTTRPAFDKWVQSHAELLKGAKPLSLAEIVEVAK